jgi:polysaccharide biosynthesis transport protein
MTLTLSNQLAGVRADLRKIEEVEAEIGELERRRASLKKQLDHVELSLQQYRASKTLDNRQNTSISKVQAPSPAVQDFAALHKKLFMAVGGGIAIGLVLAFLMELVFDRTLKRPKDVEAVLAAPLFLTIPFTRLSGVLSAPAPSSGKIKGALPAPAPGRSGGAEVVPTDLVMPRESNQELKPYHDALRDRLMNYFDVRDMTHKPKLIAVTSAGEGAGVSSVATGLAASLSETGDGNVLLVDMRGQRGAAHAFYHGKPAIGLAEALENDTRDGALVNENLYVVSAGSLDKKLQRILLQQFSQFVPKLKASDYDYIIFDMPPVGQTSVTAKVARFMDMVLMVVESENTDKDAAKRAGTLLADANATVATVLNKHRPYVPAWLHQDIH